MNVIGFLTGGMVAIGLSYFGRAIAAAAGESKMLGFLMGIILAIGLILLEALPLLPE